MALDATEFAAAIRKGRALDPAATREGDGYVSLAGKILDYLKSEGMDADGRGCLMPRALGPICPCGDAFCDGCEADFGPHIDPTEREFLQTLPPDRWPAGLVEEDVFPPAPELGGEG